MLLPNAKEELWEILVELFIMYLIFVFICLDLGLGLFSFYLFALAKIVFMNELFSFKFKPGILKLSVDGTRFIFLRKYKELVTKVTDSKFGNKFVLAAGGLDVCVCVGELLVIDWNFLLSYIRY